MLRTLKEHFIFVPKVFYQEKNNSSFMNSLHHDINRNISFFQSCDKIVVFESCLFHEKKTENHFLSLVFHQRVPLSKTFKRKKPDDVYNPHSQNHIYSSFCLIPSHPIPFSFLSNPLSHPLPFLIPFPTPPFSSPFQLPISNPPFPTPSPYRDDHRPTTSLFFINFCNYFPTSLPSNQAFLPIFPLLFFCGYHYIPHHPPPPLLFFPFLLSFLSYPPPSFSPPPL